MQVSLTPFGRTGPRADWQTSDLVAGAMSGVLSISGTPDQAIGAWGRQNLTFGSLMACICGLAGVHAARETGQGCLVDLSLHEVMTSSIENLFFQWWFPDLLPIPQRALRQGSLHWLGAYVVANAKRARATSPRSRSRPLLFEWMAEEGDPEGAELAKMTIEDALAEMPRVMNAIRRFALTKDSGELFLEAQRRHIAFGEVQTVAQVAANPQYEFRGTFRAVEGFADVRMPGPYARFHATPSPRAAAAARRHPTTSTRCSPTGAGCRPSAPTPPERRHDGPFAAGKPLAGLRVVDFTWVLAGPFANRILGDLGADILKFQTAERATLVNSPDFPYFYVWNRSKRLVSLDMKRPEALDIIRARHRAVRRPDGELLRRRPRPLGHRLRAGEGVEPGDHLRHDERAGPRGTVVEDDHLRPDDPRPVRADVPLQPARPARRRARLLAQRPRRRDVRGGRRAVGRRGPAPHRRGPAHRHRPDGDRHLPHRAGGARLPHQRSRGAPHRQRRSVRPVVPERGVPLRRPARGRHHVSR